MMKKADIIISDSGGIQEEAPSFRKPVLVTREFTERPEGVKEGFSFLVGTNKTLIIQQTRELLNMPVDFKDRKNPYGDGNAAKYILEFLEKQDS